jgi:hypothetical protein
MPGSSATAERDRRREHAERTSDVACANPACDRPLPALVVREGDAYCRRSCLVAVEGDPWRRDDEEADVRAVGAGADLIEA